MHALLAVRFVSSHSLCLFTIVSLDCRSELPPSSSTWSFCYCVMLGVMLLEKSLRQEWFFLFRRLLSDAPDKYKGEFLFFLVFWVVSVCTHIWRLEDSLKCLLRRQCQVSSSEDNLSPVEVETRGSWKLTGKPAFRHRAGFSLSWSTPTRWGSWRF